MKLGMAGHTCNPSIQEVEARRIATSSCQSELHSETLFQRTKNQTKPKQNQQKCSDRILTGITLAGQFGET